MNKKRISCLSIIALLAIMAMPGASAWRGITGDTEAPVTFNAGFVHIPQSGTKDVYPYLIDLTQYGYVPENAKIHMYVTNPTRTTLEFSYYINGRRYDTAYIKPRSTKLIESHVDIKDLVYGKNNKITFETSVDPIVSGYLATRWAKVSEDKSTG